MWVDLLPGRFQYQATFTRVLYICIYISTIPVCLYINTKRFAVYDVLLN